ncbi:MAG: SPOR domain-containing protein [Saprospiraceae bacterium]
MKVVQLFLFFLLVPIFGFAQNIAITETPPIGSMMKRFAEINAEKEEVPGWRIQLLATTDRQKVESEMQKFKMLYPDIKVDWSHSKPYYKLRAGAFGSRLETYHMLYVIKNDYPGAYPAADKLKPEELLH